MNKQNKIRRSLKFSFLDGIFASAMTGFTSDYIAPYALALKASNSQIGILNAVTNLTSSVVQLKSADSVEKLKSRRKIINTFVFLHLLMGIPIIFLPVMFKWHPVIWLILFVALFSGFNAFAGPAWSSLMADYIPRKSRGKFFGWRNKALGIVTVASAFIAGVILYLFHADVLRGFFIIFSVAFICRFISWCFLTQMYEPAYKVKPAAYFSFFDFVRRLKHSNFAKFVFFVASLNFCVNLASPFFSVYMLKELKLNYLAYTILVTSVAIAQIFTFDRWGRHADRVGNLRVLRITALIISTLPLWWIIYHHTAYLALIQMLSGLAWAGFNLCATNFIYDAVTPEKRVRCIAYFNVCTGLALCCGAFLGGYLVNILPELLGSRILCLFLFSAVLRLIVSGSFLGKLKEVRPVETISHRDLFYSMIGIRPMSGLVGEAQQMVREEE